VVWHQAGFLSCDAATDSRLYLSTSAWWSGVEIPYGSVAELLWVRAYTANDLHAGGRTPWAIFRSEWACWTLMLVADSTDSSRMDDGRGPLTDRRWYMCKTWSSCTQSCWVIFGRYFWHVLDLIFALLWRFFDLVSDLIWCEGVGVGVGARDGRTWAGRDYL